MIDLLFAVYFVMVAKSFMLEMSSPAPLPPGPQQSSLSESEQSDFEGRRRVNNRDKVIMI
jgi:hypothetical protein